MKKSHGLWLAALALGVLGAACAEAPEIDGPEGAMLTSEVSDEATDEVDGRPQRHEQVLEATAVGGVVRDLMFALSVISDVVYPHLNMITLPCPLKNA